MPPESEATFDSTPVVRTRSLSVDEQRDVSENDANARKEFNCKASVLGVSQQRIGSGRFCRKCGHVIATSQQLKL
jgi:hypothetical protein